MELSVIKKATETLTISPKDKARERALELAPLLNGLTKDFREVVSYVVTEVRFPDDQGVAAAYAPHRTAALRKDSVLTRARNIAVTFSTVGNPFAVYPELFDLVAAVLFHLEVGVDDWRDPSSLADVAYRYACAWTNPEARVSLANWMYTKHGEQSPEMVRLLSAPSPVWLKEKLEQAIGDAKPQPDTGRRVPDAVRDRFAKTWMEITQVQPAFVLSLGVATLAVLLFGISIVAARSTVRESPAGAKVPAPAPAVEIPPTVFQQLTKRLVEKKELFTATRFLIGPRARDDGDILLAEAVTAADLKGVTVVPWGETREALGPDAPPFRRGWLSADVLGRLHHTASTTLGDKPSSQDPLTFYIDLEVDSTTQAHVSVVSIQEQPGVVLVVRGPTPSQLQPAPKSRQFLERVLDFGGNPQSPDVVLLLQQSKAAAVTNHELAQAKLTQALVFVAAGKRTEAQNEARRAWPFLSESQRQQLPDPIRRLIADETRSLDDRVRDQIELKK